MTVYPDIWIFAGRFQPLHEGHVLVARAACEAMPAQSTLVLGVVVPVGTHVGAVSDLANLAAEHHLPERNPWTVASCLAAATSLSRLLSMEYPEKRVATTAIPRPDIAWDIVKAWFPDKITWVVPNAGESFDEAKVTYFQEMGDKVKRFVDNSKVDGRAIRAAFERDPTSAALLLPEIVRETFVLGWPKLKGG